MTPEPEPALSGHEAASEPANAPGPVPDATRTGSEAPTGRTEARAPTQNLITLIGRRIRAARLAEGWTLGQLADRIRADDLFDVRLTANQIGKVETGKRELSIIELTAIGEALNVHAPHLMRPGVICGACGQEMPGGAS